MFIAVLIVHIQTPEAQAGAASWWVEYCLFIGGLAALSTGMAIHLQSAKKVVLVADTDAVQIYRKDSGAATTLSLEHGLGERGLVFADFEFQAIERVKTLDDSSDMRSPPCQ
jgi:hypothetical protein